MSNDKEYIFTEKDTKNWELSKSKIAVDRKKLSELEIKTFLQLMCSLASPVIFQRKLGISSRDVESYKQELNVHDQESARKMLKKLELDIEQRKMQEIEQNRLASLSRQEEVSKRLAVNSLEGKKKTSAKKVDKEKIRKEDAKRQTRHNKQLSELSPVSDFRSEDPRQFEIDIRYGMSFCCKKYNVQPSDIYAEIARLKIDVNIDNIRR
jgi:hypothetical protein